MQKTCRGVSKVSSRRVPYQKEMHTHGHVAKCVSESVVRSQALFSNNVHLCGDIYIFSFLDKWWAGFCWIKNVHWSSHQLDDKHMHSSDKGNGHILKTKPVFLFQGRSAAHHCRRIWQGHAGRAVTFINNCYIEQRHLQAAQGTMAMKLLQ